MPADARLNPKTPEKGLRAGLRPDGTVEILNSQFSGMDAIDVEILNKLQENARATGLEIAKTVGLTPPRSPNG
jgi:hypothetical protein